ncbi:MAG TPA: DUF3500 domain-containing protein [Bryobacteraceae bacterium]|jgi:hypothetical protein|nr:DUF3500 domain-containing protein [Bryobacteraceae bacterium]
MRTLPRLLLASAGIVMLTAAYYKINSPAVMTDAAKAFLASLPPDQKARATFAFTDEERFNWHFIPRVRKGLAFREMSPGPRQLAHALLAAGLSQQGVIKADTVMSLDQVLKEIEVNPTNERDPEKYYFSIFGEPSETGTWAYRVEGHHLALNFTIVKGHVASTPSFFGANPAEVRGTSRNGLRTLAREEDLGRAVVKSLTDAQRTVAIVDKEAYKDIITMASRKAAIEGKPSGLPFGKLTPKQRELLESLVAEYANDFPPTIAEARMEQFKKSESGLYFAWAGGIEKGDPHYYRIQTPAFLIEYDDTQNNANHIHSVWRDFDGDFGTDLLSEHYQTSHKH